MTQAELFEPRADECAALAAMHVKKAEAFRRSVEVFEARGWLALQADHAARAAQHEHEAECLAMYAHFLRLAGLAA